MKELLLQIWKNPELRGKILFTLGILFFVRTVAHIPLPLIDRDQLLNFLSQSENQVFGVLSMFTGGSIERLSVDLLGLGPYITASIIVQLLTKVIPSWEATSKEGTAGREKLNQYSRYLTPPLALVQGYGMLALLKSQGVLMVVTTTEILQMLLTVSAVSVFMMWLGEMISERGIGNGISIIIALSIVAGLPQQIVNTASIAETGATFNLAIFGAISLATVAIIVFVNEAVRKIPITYAKHASGPVTRTGVDSHLPVKVNTAGVIPIIFALSFLTFPAIVARFLSTANSPLLVKFADKVTQLTSDQLIYGVAFFVLVFAFTFFYTYIVFEPKQVAENLQKQGSFIPGVRPGTETIQFLGLVISRVTVMGAIFLAAIAVLPIVVERFVNIPTLIIGGTGILIVVSVVVETSRQLASHISMRRYDTI